MIVLGVDPSLNKTGYGVLKKEGAKIIFLTSGVIDCTKLESTEKKLLQISNTLNDVIKEFKPVKVGMEKTFVNSNPQTSLLLGMARGAIMVTIASCNLSITEFAPNFIKKAITGNGKAEKEQLSFMVKKLISGIPPEKSFKTLDETDALSVAFVCSLNLF